MFDKTIRLLIVSFIWLRENISVKYLLIGGDVCPPMSKRCRHVLCPDWLNNLIFNFLSCPIFDKEGLILKLYLRMLTTFYLNETMTEN